MCGGQYLRGMSQGIADERGTTITSSTVDRQPGKLNNWMFEGGRARGSELNAQINATSKKTSTPKKTAAPKKESTPPLPKSSGDSGLSIRRSSRSSSNTSNRRGGSSRAGARKRYKTT